MWRLQYLRSMFWLSVKTMTRSSTGRRSRIDSRRGVFVSRVFFFFGVIIPVSAPLAGVDEEEAAALMSAAALFLPRMRKGVSGISRSLMLTKVYHRLR